MKNILCLLLLLSSGIAKATQIDTVYFFVEQMPVFNGNINKYLRENLRYTSKDIKNGHTGRVVAKYYVDTTGYTDSVTIEQSAGEVLDNELIRVIKNMPRWQPGIQNGKPVKVYYSLPVNFRNDETPYKPDTTNLARQRKLQDSLNDNHPPNFKFAWNQFVYRKLSTPAKYQYKGANLVSRVFLTVKTDGYISTIAVEKKPGMPEIDAEALRVANKLARHQLIPGKKKA